MTSDRKELTISVRQAPNPDYREYSTGWPVSKYSIGMFSVPMMHYKKDDLSKIGKRGATIVCRILRVPGVVELFIHSDSVSVIKSRIFSWEDIEPAVLEIIKKSAGWAKRFRVEVINAGQPDVYQSFAKTDRRIEICLVPNKAIRDYDVNRKVSNTTIHGFSSSRCLSKAEEKEIGRVGAGIIRRLSKIPGVKEGWIRPYEITVNLSSALLSESDPQTRWEDVEPLVLRAIMGSRRLRKAIVSQPIKSKY